MRYQAYRALMILAAAVIAALVMPAVSSWAQGGGRDTANAPATPVGACDTAVAYRGRSGTFSCTCSAEAVTMGRVWGDGLYTDDSSICAAAVHAGAIGPAGGTVVFQPRPGAASYSGSQRSGITSRPYGPWQGSFSVRGGRLPQAAAPPTRTGSIPARAGTPTNIGSCSYANQAQGRKGVLGCYCDPMFPFNGRVWGDGIYTDDSPLCTAGVHAGVIDRGGGWLFFEVLPGQQSYASATRNGITSSAYGPNPASMRFVAVSAAARKAIVSAPVAAPRENVLPSEWELADLSGDRTCLIERAENTTYRNDRYWNGFEWRTSSEKETEVRRISNRCNRALAFQHQGTRRSVAARGSIALRCYFTSGENPFGTRITTILYCSEQ